MKQRTREREREVIFRTIVKTLKRRLIIFIRADKGRITCAGIFSEIHTRAAYGVSYIICLSAKITRDKSFLPG